jgi:glycerophosphoryl diester phosphodiesterase
MSRPRVPGLSRERPSPKRALPANENPLIIAHRGESGDIAEHTLPAYVAAIERGADGLECDVRLTRDGHLVCVHDRTVNRTSNGSGVVSELDLSGLQALDFQSWKAQDSPSDSWPAYGDPGAADLAGQDPGAGSYLAGQDPGAADLAGQDPGAGSYLAGVAPDRVELDGSRVLTLQRLLSTVHDAGRPLTLLIETKHPTRYGGLVEKELVRVLRRFGLAGTKTKPQISVTIMSFAPVALRRVRLLAPTVPLTLLLDRTSTIRRDGSLPHGVSIAGPGIKLVRTDPDYVARAHAHGHQVFCWTVDKPDDIAAVADLGVDAIITNHPRRVRRQLGR